MSNAEMTTSFQRDLLANYATSLCLQADAHYYGGARLRPVVPLDTAVGSYFILGAYPSARFEVVDSENDVPVGDNLGPFEAERYFDGRRVRTQASTDELNKFYLVPLGIPRTACWVTDLVRVFLFKLGHREKYQRLAVTPPIGYERERFDELGRRSLPWLHREVLLAKPKLVITLGAEVAGIVRDITGDAGRTALLGPTITPVRYGSIEVPTVHLAQPGIVMRKSGDDSRNPWPRRHAEEHIPALLEALKRL